MVVDEDGSVACEALVELPSSNSSSFALGFSGFGLLKLNLVFGTRRSANQCKAPQCSLVFLTGNPGVFPRYPYPYPPKPLPGVTGTGFGGLG